MTTVVDIPEDLLLMLDRLSETRQTSRDELLREAITIYVKRRLHPDLERGFGAWADFPEDGLAYQKRLRDEW